MSNNIWIKYNKISDTDAIVETQNYDPYNPITGIPTNLLNEGVFVDSIPEPTPQDGQTYELHINPTTLELSYVYSTLDLNTVKQNKISAIKQECYNLITAGFNSKIKYNEIHKYTLTDIDQANMLTLIQNINMGATVVPWHYEGMTVCDAWSSDDFKTLYQQANEFGTNLRTKSDYIEKYINEQTLTVDEINAITMEFTLPSDYQIQFENTLATFNCPIWVEPTA